jgi:hypothetical protein
LGNINGNEFNSNSKWGHDGFEELMRMEEQEERRRRIVHRGRAGFVVSVEHPQSQVAKEYPVFT